MYNLLMAGNKTFWDNGLAEYTLDRYLEHTVDAIKGRFSPITDKIVEELKNLPTLFAYEFPNALPSRVGRILEIRLRHSTIQFSFEFDERVPPITHEQMKSLVWDLDIDDKTEIYRHHWAVKDVDLSKALEKLGIANYQLKPAQLKEINAIAKGLPALDPNAARTKVFIVHGRSEAIKHDVARFVERIGLEAVILHEQANGGRTLISKFQEVAAQVQFAVVLMTPDDVGGLRGAEQKNRARQNVIFELGFFIGKLGAERVAALVAGDLERPSDFEAVVYLSYDDGGGWKIALAKEIKTAGIAFDPMKIL